MRGGPLSRRNLIGATAAAAAAAGVTLPRHALAQEPDHAEDVAAERSGTNIKTLGATGDGTTNDSAALADAFSPGGRFFLPAGTYYAPDLLEVTPASNLELTGVPGKTKIIGPGHPPIEIEVTSQIRMDDDISIRVRGIHFTKCGRCFDPLAGRIARLLDIRDCRFTDSGAALSASELPGLRGGFVRLVARDNEFDSCNRGIYARVEEIGSAHVTDNVFTNMGPNPIRLGVGQAAGQQLRGHFYVAGNTIKHVRDGPEQETPAAEGISCFGQQVAIVGNTIEDCMSSNGEDCEGIYTKAAINIIVGNVLLNAGSSTAAIAAKGQVRASTSIAAKSYATVVANNSIGYDPNTTRDVGGVVVQGSDTLVSDNWIEHTTSHLAAINVESANQDRVTVQGNSIYRHRGACAIRLSPGGGSAHGVLDNLISGMDGSFKKVNIQPILITITSPATLSGLTIAGNRVLDFRSTRPTKAIVLSPATTSSEISDVVLRDNVILGASVGIEIRPGVPGVVRTAWVDGNIVRATADAVNNLEAAVGVKYGINDWGGGYQLEGPIGFFGEPPMTKPTVTGARDGNAALANLLGKLAALGLITDSTDP